jgi:hypothetical protein
VLFLGHLADARVHGICRVDGFVERGQIWLGFVKMPDIVLCRVFCTPRLQQREHLCLEGFDVHAFADDIILVQNVAHEVAIIQTMYQFIRNFCGQGFQPVAFIALERDVEREDILDFGVVNILVPNGGSSSGKAVKACNLSLAGGAFEIVGFDPGKGGVQV